MPKTAKKRSFKSFRPFGATAIQKRRMAAAPRKVELKATATVVADTTIAFNTTGAVSWVNQIDEGDNINQRDGRHVGYDWTTVRLRINSAATSAAADVSARVLLVWDKKGGTLPAALDILTTVNMESGYNPAGDGRFEILADKHYPTSTGPASTYATYSVTDSFTVSLKGKKTHFASNAASIAQIESGQLLIVTCGDAVAGVNNMVGAINVNTRFHEI